MLEGPARPCTILCFNVHTTVEYVDKNVLIGQLLQHIPNSIVVCARSRPKGKQKHITKKFVRFHNHCLQLTMVTPVSGAPNDNFLSDPLKRYFRRPGVALKLYRFILGSAIIFLSVRSF